MQGESLKRIFANQRITFDGFSVIQTTKYDYTTKPQAVIHNYFRKRFLELFLGFCKTNLVIHEPIITRILAAYGSLQNRVLLSFWILIASINLCWHENQSFCGSNHPWAMRLMLIAQWHHQNKEVCLCLNVNFLYLNCCWYELQSFCERNHLCVRNHIDVYYVSTLSQIWEISVFLEAYFFSLLKNCCGLKIPKFLCK